MCAYHFMTAEDAKEILSIPPHDHIGDLTPYVRVEGTGVMAGDEELGGLRSALDSLRDQFPDPLPKEQGNAFESQACVVVHSSLRQIPDEAIVDKRFWIWMSVAEFSDVVEWRHGKQEERADLKNYGIGQPAEGLIYRLWLRGEIGYNPEENDPYRLSRLGDQDLWRSHIMRTRYGNVRALAKGLVEYHEQMKHDPSLTVHPRAIAKQLRRLGANVYFEYLEPPECGELILEIATDRALSS